ncbi:MAG TPA: replication-associated recombination protein A [Geopsychrobacteraceae bacterium]|nr:replication-associated recombination protein A [Geopsychrobacteraceae bacterium]
MDLFEQALEQNPDSPLAERMRPHSLDEVVGQQHLLGPGKLLRHLIESDQLSSVIFWGPPGTGKTTLGQVIASTTSSSFVFFSAVLQGVKDIRQIVAEARQSRAHHGRKTILFVDEIHRLNKAQQDAFLPYVEKGDITLIGATTENPSFEVNSALLSRSRVFVLESLNEEEIKILLQRALLSPRGLKEKSLQVADEALDHLAQAAQGDARIALNTLELAAGISEQNQIDLDSLQQALQKKALRYDKGAEEHYNVISAFIKSVRGSDPDAALYWLARMLEAGEDPMFIARRLVILASEDIGNADPRGLQVAISAQQALHLIGLPEGRIPLAQATTYLATAPKSNAAYIGIQQAQNEVRQSGALPVPLHIRNAPTKLMKEQDYGKGYRYPHEEDGISAQDYLPEKLSGLRYYHPTDHGYEKMIGERIAYWEQVKKGRRENKE